MRQLKDTETRQEGEGWEFRLACVHGQLYPGLHVVHCFSDYRSKNLASTKAFRLAPAHKVVRLALNPLNDESSMTVYLQDAIFKK